MICSCAPGSRKPFDIWPTGRCVRHVQQLVCAIDQHAAESVFSEQLRRAFGAPFGAGNKQDRVAALAHPFDFGDPLLDTAAKFHGRLARDVQDTVRLGSSAGSSDPTPAGPKDPPYVCRSAAVEVSAFRRTSVLTDSQLL